MTPIARGTLPIRTSVPRFDGVRIAALTALLLGLTFGIGTASISAAQVSVTSSGCHANITSVSAINSSQFGATVAVLGTCFGKGPMYIHPSSYYGSGHSGLDTLYCGNTTSPAMAITDTTAGRVWEAGIADNTSGPWSSPCSNVNGLGLKFRFWSNTAIVFNGFGNRLQHCSISGTALCQGDRLTIKVFNPYNMPAAQYAITAT